jgi:decaprenyl-phosphate phosphoribosyltransferase
MGLVYNVKPVRTKDRQYLDVLSESVNNALRVLLGWSAIISDVLPPSSILLAYWMGGAYLMAIKRYSEYRFINSSEQAGL